MKFTELYEVSNLYIEELDDVAEYGGIRDALEMLSRSRSRIDVYRDPLMAEWFKQNAGRIANYAVGEIMAEGTAGIRYEASIITNAGISLPDRTLTWYIQNMMPKLVRHLASMADDNSTGAANSMIGLKQYHGIDIKRYVTQDMLARIVADCIIDNHVGAAIKTLKSVLGASDTTSIEYLNNYKREIITSFIKDMKEADRWELLELADAVKDLQTMGIKWPELTIIADSIAADKK
jgi:hypothetical protein